MANLRELTKYQDVIISKILSNDNIVRAVADNSRDFLSNPMEITSAPTRNTNYNPDKIIYVEKETKKIDRNKLLYSRIYPWQYLTETHETQATYITFYFPPVGIRRNSLSGSIYKLNRIGFTIYTHHRLMRTSENCLRTLFIAAEIDEMLNGHSLGHSIGTLKLEDWGNINLKDGRWHGHMLSYQVLDLDNPVCGERHG